MTVGTGSGPPIANIPWPPIESCRSEEKTGNNAEDMEIAEFVEAEVGSDWRMVGVGLPICRYKNHTLKTAGCGNLHAPEWLGVAS